MESGASSPPLRCSWPPQVCFATSAHISHHLKQTVVFVDTTGGLSAGRLLQMLEAETSRREEQVSGNQPASAVSTTSQQQEWKRSFAGGLASSDGPYECSWHLPLCLI